MKKLLLASLALLAVIGFNPAEAAEVGKAAPEIEATDIDGNAFKLSDHKGKIVVLEWTNHQCPFVIKHYDSGNMQKLQAEARAMENVEWVSIVSSAPGKQGHVSPTQAKEILAKNNADVTTQILDSDGKIGRVYGAKTTPHMFIVDADGVIAYAGAIDDNSSPRQSAIPNSNNLVRAALNDLTAGNDVQIASSAPYGCSVKY